MGSVSSIAVIEAERHASYYDGSVVSYKSSISAFKLLIQYVAAVKVQPIEGAILVQNLLHHGNPGN